MSVGGVKVVSVELVVVVVVGAVGVLVDVVACIVLRVHYGNEHYKFMTTEAIGHKLRVGHNGRGRRRGC